MNYAKFEGPMLLGAEPTSFIIIFKDGNLHGHFLDNRKLPFLTYMKSELDKDPESFDLKKAAYRAGGIYYKVGVYPLNPEIEEAIHRMYPIKDTTEKTILSSLETAARWARGARKMG